jgi:hypothetical protein
MNAQPPPVTFAPLRLYENASAALAELHRIDEVKDIRDKAVALEIYARQAKDTELIDRATEIRMRAEIRAGQLLREMEKAKGGEQYHKCTGSPQEPVHTLADLGVTKKQSHKWQKLAALSEAEQNTIIAEAKSPRTREGRGSKAEKLNAALRHAQAAEAQTGKLPPEKELAAAAGVSPATANEALQIIRHNRPEDIGRVQLTKTTNDHIEAAMKHRLREWEKDFDERVRLAMLEHNKDYRSVLEESKKRAEEKEERYNNLINDFKPLFTETEYTVILTCLHPDNVASKEKRDTAFKAFNAMKFQLTGKK